MSGDVRAERGGGWLVDAESGGFLGRLRTALRGSPGGRLVLLGNFEVEDWWAEGEWGLPQIPIRRSAAVVNRMDEFVLLLAGEADTVVVKREPDRAFLSYLREIGLPLPQVLHPRRQDPERVVTLDVLDDPDLLRSLRDLGADHAALLPHGVSALEERLAAQAGLSLAGSPATLCKTVNSKIFSRRIADELGLPQPTGWTCDTVGQWRIAAAGARDLLSRGGRVVVKDAFGVSGRGLLVIDAERRLNALDKKIHKRAERTGDERLALVVEAWIDRGLDLNYQVTVGRDGATHVDFVKRAITERGVHKGHRMPVDVSPDHEAALERAAGALGGRLAAEGYVGLAGIDAMIDVEGRLYPVVEINARSNMSTYQVRIQELLVDPGHQVWARHYPLHLGRVVPFEEIRAAFDGVLVTGPGRPGVLVINTATVNAASERASRDASDDGFDGRLYTMLVADTPERLAALDAETTRRLGVLEREAGGTR